MKAQSIYKKEVKKIVLSSLKNLDADVFLFGSQVTGKTHRASDFDIGYSAKPPLPASKLQEIQEQLEESSIPNRVDLVNFEQTSPAFKRIAFDPIEIWKRKKRKSVFESTPSRKRSKPSKKS